MPSIQSYPLSLFIKQRHIETNPNNLIFIQRWVDYQNTLFKNNIPFFFDRQQAFIRISLKRPSEPKPFSVCPPWHRFCSLQIDLQFFSFSRRFPLFFLRDGRPRWRDNEAVQTDLIMKQYKLTENLIGFSGGLFFAFLCLEWNSVIRSGNANVTSDVTRTLRSRNYMKILYMPSNQRKGTQGLFYESRSISCMNMKIYIL